MSVDTINLRIRILQDQLTRYHPDMRCFDNLCDHDLPVPALPPGVRAIVGYGKGWPRDDRQDKVILIRYTPRDGGGWYVVRADNGRHLGWVVKTDHGVNRGQWTAHVCSTAFTGSGPDDEGSIMDRVDPPLHRGDPGTAGATSASLGNSRNRSGAAQDVICHLVYYQAPAVGYGRHPQVRVYHDTPDKHYASGIGDDRCSCQRAWPCLVKADLEDALTKAAS